MQKQTDGLGRNRSIDLGAETDERFEPGQRTHLHSKVDHNQIREI